MNKITTDLPYTMQDTIVIGGGGSFEKIDSRTHLTGYLFSCIFLQVFRYDLNVDAIIATI